MSKIKGSYNTEYSNLPTFTVDDNLIIFFVVI